jgi:hypothetical protein
MSEACSFMAKEDQDIFSGSKCGIVSFLASWIIIGDVVNGGVGQPTSEVEEKGHRGGGTPLVLISVIVSGNCISRIGLKVHAWSTTGGEVGT